MLPMKNSRIYGSPSGCPLQRNGYLSDIGARPVAAPVTQRIRRDSADMPYRRHYSSRNNGTGLVGFLAGCLAGIVLGAVMGILMAPHRGDITRRKLARRAEETRDQVVEKVEDLMVHRSEDEEDGDEAATS